MQLDDLKIFLIIIDVLIVAFIIYRVYLLLRRTRAIQLLIGFGLILLLDLLAERLSFETLSWLIKSVSSYLVFGIIVLLQPELRRMVIEIGNMRLFRWLQPPRSVPLTEICEAVKIMAQERIGSIIVILRDIRAQSIIDSAVKLDSLISRELLLTVFHKDTALHDGAVVIEANRIVAASCYLPLSSARILKKTYGARHRAAMGISEETDAIVIVTSEETGKIALLVNGEMKTPVKHMELQPTIARLLKAEEKEITAILRGERT
ncbi:MAG: TIGR00159 family protein [Spirochaetales bacterium]|nr:TIGR00159 family protein [Spirochaetales bacterium]